jgi:hypothetical protein
MRGASFPWKLFATALDRAIVMQTYLPGLTVFALRARAWLFQGVPDASFGAWSEADLCDHKENRKRVLWTWACNCRENPGAYDYLYLGI